MSTTTLDLRQITQTATQANLLRLIMRLHGTTRIIKDGVPYLAIQLDKMAEMIGLRARSSVSRALKWLEANGFIRITRDRWNRSPRLYLRPLIRVKETPPLPCDHISDATSTQREKTVTGCVGATSCLNPPEKKENLEAGTPPETGTIPVLAKALKGSLKDAEDRIAEKRKEVREHARAKPPTPQAVAHEWVRLLGEYGYLGFTPTEPKHLKHVGKTIKLFDCKTGGLFVAELERRIAAWQDKRPKALGKAPPHPWAINRTDILFQVETGPLDPADLLPPGYEKPTAMLVHKGSSVDEPKEGSPTPKIGINYAKFSGSLLSLLNKGKENK